MMQYRNKHQVPKMTHKPQQTFPNVNDSFIQMTDAVNSRGADYGFIAGMR